MKSKPKVSTRRRSSSSRRAVGTRRKSAGSSRQKKKALAAPAPDEVDNSEDRQATVSSDRRRSKSAAPKGAEEAASSSGLMMDAVPLVPPNLLPFSAEPRDHRHEHYKERQTVKHLATIGKNLEVITVPKHVFRPPSGTDAGKANPSVHTTQSVKEESSAWWMKKASPKDSQYRLQAIRLPFWITFLAEFSYIWEVVLYFMTISSFFIVTYSAFFAFFESGLWDVIYVSDLIFESDIVMRLLVEVWRYRNQVTVVVFTVPYSVFQFVMDLVTVIPLHQFYIWVRGTKSLDVLSLIDYYRFNRFIRLYRAYIFSTTLENERRVNEKAMFLLRFLNYYIVFIHIVSCLLMYIVWVEPIDFLLTRKRVSDDPKTNWLLKTWMRVIEQKTGKYYYPTEEPYQVYVLATSLSTAVVTTVGYGDLYATNEAEMILCILFMLVGAIFLNGYFTSQLTTFELEMDGARFDLFFRLKEIKKYLKTVGTLPVSNAKVEEYYKYLWSYREGVYEVQFMKSVPLSFHEDLLFDISQELFDKSFLFNGTEEALLRAVSKIVQVALYNPQMIICRKGGYANKLYYILQGECRVMSKYRSGKPAAILRAGSIIGETNLFFSYPYTATIETRTCCQFLTLEKEEFIKILTDFRDQLLLLRAKSQEKVVKLYEMHQIYGVEPICWVAAKTDLTNPSEPTVATVRRTMRWGSGRNREVIEDVIDDTKDCVIFDTPTLNKSIEKNHLTPYITCTVPEIMDTDIEWIEYWNTAMMISALIYAFMGPYCCFFGENSEFQQRICKVLAVTDYVMMFVYAFDVVVEIIAAAPVYGLYYKFWDGLKVQKSSVLFYIDVIAAFPIFVFKSRGQDIFKILDTVFKSLKLLKIIRYLHFLDNRYPMKLFWFRLCQTFLVLMYGIHFIACISYHLACPEDPSSTSASSAEICNAYSWLHSYETKFESTPTSKSPSWRLMETLRDSAPYLYSFFYSSATLTSAGFGDFSPQRWQEMPWAIFFQLVGFFLIGYYTSTLTSALSCVVRPKLTFQQKLMTIQQFMTDSHLKEGLRDRIVEYFRLQNQLRGGVTLAKGVYHMMYDTPEYLKDDVLYLEIVDLVEGIPVFSKCESEVIIKISSMMKRFVIPPGTTFLHKGEIRRVMYLIKHGSVGIFNDHSDEPRNILEASAHFGIRDLLFGEPCHFTVRSLSYVYIYSIKFHQVQEALAEETEFWTTIEQEKKRLQTNIDEMIDVYAQYSKAHRIRVEDIPVPIPSWVIVPGKPISTVVFSSDPHYREKKQAILANKEYDSPFKLIWGGSLWRFFLMKRTIHPCGMFGKFWSCIMSVTSFVIVILMCLETFQSFRRPYFRIFQWFLDILAVTDIYVKMHWGYYNSKSNGNDMLITHPLKTAVNYMINGTFVLDVLAASPLELIIPLMGWTNIFGYGDGAVWYTKLRWTRVLQLKRLSLIFEIAHTVFKRRDIVLLSLYVITTVFLCTLLGSVTLYTACPWGAQFWKKGDEYRMPVCLQPSSSEEQDFWATKTTDPDSLASPINRWVLGVYYVSQVLLVIGFGDLITLRTTDLVILIFMMVFGFIFMRCVIADITAAEVDSDEIRSNYLEQIKTLTLVMRRERVPKRLTNTVMEHLNYTWKRSKGVQPRELFSDLHLALESDLFKELVGKELARVPFLRDVPANILRTISGFLRKQYFLRGSRIMRCGNLENEMNIILRGKVYISDAHFNYLCTLTTGDCFGESSMLKGKRRCYNAVAVTNVEIYYLTDHNFQLILERYPAIKNEFEKVLGGGERDYFEHGMDTRIRQVDNMSKDQHKALLNSFIVRSKLIRSSLETKEDLGGVSQNYMKTWLTREFWIGYGTLDDNLPIVYFASARYRKIGDTFAIMIHPKCLLMLFFNGVINRLCLLTAAIATYETCFIGGTNRTPKDSHGLSELDEISLSVIKFSEVLEWLFISNLLLKFITPFEASDGVFCKTYRGIAVRYVTSMKDFWVDFVGCLPWIVDTSITDRKLQETSEKYIFLLKLVRLVRFYEFELGKKYDLSVSTIRYKMTISVTSFCAMAHMLACVFYNISACRVDKLTRIASVCETETGDRTWTSVFKSENDLKEKDDFLQWKWWIRSLYWVVTTVSTTGFGDITPYTVSEMLLAIICTFCGAFILSVILSHFTAGLASQTKPFREFMYQVQLLVRHLRNIGLSKTRQDQVMMHFLMLWDRCRGTSYNKATSILPVSMQIEVCKALFGDCLSSVPYFQGHDQESFIRQLSYRVLHSVFIPGVCIVKEGDYGSSMFLVFKGLVSATKLQGVKLTPKASLGRKKSIREEEVQVELEGIYNVGDIFGRFPALFHGETYKKSYRAETRVEVLELRQADILDLCEHFGFFQRNLIHLIQSRYSALGNSVNIFTAMSKKRDLFNLEEEIRGAKAGNSQGYKKKKESEFFKMDVISANVSKYTAGDHGRRNRPSMRSWRRSSD